MPGLGLGLGLQLNNIPLVGILNPANIPNLAAWYKGDAGLTLVGGEVDVWADQSGNGRNLSAAASINRPTLSTRNGKNVLVFNGSTKYLRSLTAALARNVSGLTIIVAGNSASATTLQQAQCSISTLNTISGFSRASIGWGYNASRNGRDAVGRRNNTDTIAGCGQFAYNPDWGNNSARFNYSVAILQTYVNNIPTDSLNPFQTAGNTPNDGGALFIGSGVDTLGRFLNGQIGEILIYERALTDTELANIQIYLSSRW